MIFAGKHVLVTGGGGGSGIGRAAAIRFAQVGAVETPVMGTCAGGAISMDARH